MADLPAKTNKQLLAESREEKALLRRQIREQKEQAEPTGMSRLTINATGGYIAGVGSEISFGEVFGQKVTAEPVIAAASLLQDVVTDGKLPGGIAGKACRVLRASGDTVIQKGFYDLGKASACLARKALTR